MRGDRPALLTAVVAIAAVAGLHLNSAWGSTQPIFFTDEIGYLFNAEIMAGVGLTPSLTGGSYYLGWSVLLVPLWWVTQDPQNVYLGAMVLSVLCGVAVVVPAYLVARRLGLSPLAGILAAAAVSVAPSRTVMSNFALAENFIALLVAVSALAAFRFAERASLGRAAVLLGVTSYLAITHARLSPLAIAAGLWVVMLGLRRLPLLWALLVPVAVVVPGMLAYRAIVAPMYETAGREERGLGRLLSLDPAAALTATFGQLWYVFAAWFGFALLGLIWVAMRAVGEARERRIGIALWAAASFVGVLGISVVWIAGALERGDPRYDLYAYGRYLDSVLFLFALVGISRVRRGATRRLLLGWLVPSVLVTAIFFIFIVPQVPTAGAWFGPNSVPGIIQWEWPLLTAATSPPWIPASSAALFVVVAAIAATIERMPATRPAVLVATMALLAFSVSSVAAESRSIRPSYDAWYESFTLRHAVEAALARYPDAEIAFDDVRLSDSLGGADTVSHNAYQYWLVPRQLPVFDSAEDDPVGDLVISRKEWPQGEAVGARKVADDTGLFDNALWVLPGPVQDALAADGALVDGGVPSDR